MLEDDYELSENQKQLIECCENLGLDCINEYPHVYDVGSFTVYIGQDEENEKEEDNNIRYGREEGGNYILTNITPDDIKTVDRLFDERNFEGYDDGYIPYNVKIHALKILKRTMTKISKKPTKKAKRTN